MEFYEVLKRVLEVLERQKRVTYRALKRQFNLDDDFLEDLKAELIDAQRLATDEDGKVLVWTGARAAAPAPTRGVVSAPARQDAQASQVSPIAYTPRHLAERILAEQAAMEARGAPDGERKTITALFADIKGSMALLEDLDPEEARRIIDPALKLMMEAVHRYEGYVAQSLGDGIFALFGAPIAHEDHAHRALYAALRLQEEIRRYADQLRLAGGVPIQIRVGVNTGEVVVRAIRTDDLHTDYVPIGHSTGLAARMQALATPGSILATGESFRLTEGYFAFRALGAAPVHGVREPVPMYEVLGVGPLRTRLQVAAHRALVRFVGRQRELEQMQRALEQARSGRGQMVAVVGEPGVGKSRLCYEFKVQAQRDCLVLETFSVSHGKAYPYLPLIELLKHYFQLGPEDDPRRRREQVTGKILTLERGLEDTLPYLLALLGDPESIAALAPMDPPLRRRRTFEAINRVLLRESLGQPLLLLVEDLHWLDSETDAWLQGLSERIATARVLLLVNYRPEYQHAWGNKTVYTQLRLDPLGPAEAQELLAALLGESPDLAPLKQFILAKTEGNPFFMEEIGQALLEQGVLVRQPAGGVALAAPALAGSLTSLQLPATVQGLLAARIDRLPTDEKALLQTLAVIGKEFALGLLRQVVAQPEGELQGQLSRLQAAEFLYERPAFPEPEYTFKHALTQEVAYNSLLVERRRTLHERTGQAIETLYGDRLEDRYPDLAYHYSHSGNTTKAIVYLERAGQQALQRSAYSDAIQQLTTALGLLKTLPENAERAEQELAIQTALGLAFIATKSYGAPEVAQAYTRARELCQQMGETSQLFPVLWGLERYYLVRAEHQTAGELAEQLLSLAQQQRDPALLLEAHRALGQSLCWRGRVAEAWEHLERAIAIYDPQQHRTHAVRYGRDPGVDCRCYMAWVLWWLGYPEQGLRHLEEALPLAQALSHPFSLATVLIEAAIVHQLRREAEATQARAEAAIAVSTEQGFPLWLAFGQVLRGWALAVQGQEEEGIAQLHQGLAAWRAIGQEFLRPYLLTMLAEAYALSGQTEAGLAAVAEALAAVEATGERFWEAKLHRLQGECLLAQEGKRQRAKDERQKVEEAETCFRQALDIARRQGAKMYELRAATSLSRLWQGQGKRAEARELLAPIYTWFTEGFDTADLQEARALLDVLA